MKKHAVVSSEEWTARRKELLVKEKEFTRLRDHSKITSHFSEDAEYSFAWVEYRVDGGKVPPSVGRKL